MIKLFIGAFLMLSFFSANAWGEFDPATDGYIIVSDSTKSDVPSGKCRVKGQVVSNYGNVANSIVANLNRTHHTTSDSLGYYEFEIPASDTSIFFYKEGFDGVVIWSYPFKSGHEVTINFYLDQQMIISFKPVIYCYSDSLLTASIKLNPAGEFTFTYPEYNEGWDIRVLGTTGIEFNKQEYPYLFWEGLTPDLKIKETSTSIEGFYVPANQLSSSLDENLTALGLNATERADFITYWVPRFTDSEYVFYQFLSITEYQEQVASIEVDPKPDSMQRVYALFRTENGPSKKSVTPQVLLPFERNGFTLVEWGGSIIDHQTDKP